MAKAGGGSVGKSWGKLAGNAHMEGFSGAGTQKPAVSSQEGKGGRRDQKAPTGSAHGFFSSSVKNRDYAGTQEAGVSASSKKGGNSKFASGGTTKMFGNSGSQRVEGGRSSR